MYAVERNVPMPESRQQIVYPFGCMKKGDSFEFPAEDYDKVSSASSYWAKKLKHKYSFRKINDESYRTWRVE